MTTSRVLRLVPAAVLVLGLAACTDDDPDAGGSTPSASATGSTGSTPDATSPAAETPSAPETPSVVAATGKEIGVAAVSIRVTDSPEWRVNETAVNVVALLPAAPAGILTVSLVDAPNLPGRDTDDKGDSFERTLSVEPTAPKRVANRVLDGVECFVLDGRTDELHHYVVGAVVGDRVFLLQFKVPAGLADGDQVVEQMLASIDVKDG